MTATDEQPRRLTPSEREHELAMSVVTRPPRTPNEDIEVGQEARTKEWYVKSLSVPKAEGEGWKPWLERVGAIAALAREVLPQPEQPDAPKTKRSTAQPTGMSDEVPF